MQQMENVALSVRDESIQKQIGILQEVDVQITKLIDAGVKDKTKDKKSLPEQQKDITLQLSKLKQMQQDIKHTRIYSETIKSKNPSEILIAAGELRVEGRRLLSELAQIESKSIEDMLMYQQRLKNYILRIKQHIQYLKLQITIPAQNFKQCLINIRSL